MGTLWARLVTSTAVLGEAVLLPAGVWAAAGTVVTAPPAGTSAEARASYVNPVSKDFADTYADPAVLRGKDGFW